jgi:Tfp pilus assembly protein PilO
MLKLKTILGVLIRVLGLIHQRIAVAQVFLRNTPPERIRWYALAGLLELGWLGIVGIGIFVMCMVLYFSALRPGEERLQVLRDRVEQQAKPGIKPGSTVDASKDPVEQLAIFYRAFPLRSSVPKSLETIYLAAADEGLKLDQADYKASSFNAGKLTRYQITFPIKGGYSNIHKFLVRVLREIPTASLERVLFERKKINDTSVDATVTLVLHLGPGT